MKNTAFLPFGKLYNPLRLFSIFVSTIDLIYVDDVLAVKQHLTQTHGLELTNYLAIEVLPEPEGPAKIIG